MKIIDLTNERFDRLKVLEYAYTKNKKKYWKCECICGNISYVCTHSLISKNSKSCGCLNREAILKYNKSRDYNDVKQKMSENHCDVSGKNNPNYKHGKCGTKEYVCGVSAKRRATKLNQTPENANIRKIQLYYTVCAYLNSNCEIPMWHVDHIKPISKSGLHHEDNLQILTAAINLQKNDKYPLTDGEQVLYKGVTI